MSSTNMKKSYLLATFISSLFITGNASAETNSADAGAYSAYKGSGYGDRRLKESISDDEKITYYYHESGPLKGKLKSFQTVRTNGSTETMTLEYEATGFRLSKATQVSARDGKSDSHTIVNTYGPVAFKPLITTPTIASSDYSAVSSGCATTGTITYTYNLEGVAAVSLAKTQLKTQAAVDARTCKKVNITIDRDFTYDEKGRLTNEDTKMVEGNFLSSALTYQYDNSDRLKKVTEVIAPGNPLMEETSVTNYGVDAQGRAYAISTTETRRKKTRVSKHVYEDKTCFYHYMPNFHYPSGEKSMGLCLR